MLSLSLESQIAWDLQLTEASCHAVDRSPQPLGRSSAAQAELREERDPVEERRL